MLTDGTVASQAAGSKWGDIKDAVDGLILKTDDMELVLPLFMSSYIQRQSGECDLNGSNFQTKSRTVGFVTPSGDEVTITFLEGRGKAVMEVKKKA